MKEFKIWAQIEEVNEKDETYEDRIMPECIGTYSTIHEAFVALQALKLHAHKEKEK